MTEAARLTDPEEIRRILDERAADLARAPQGDAGGATVALVVVRVGQERYGIAIDRVREIRAYTGVTPMPGTPAAWCGLANFRGALHPVLDLARALGQGADPGGTPDAQIVLVSGSGMTVGLRVDDAASVRTVAVADIGPSLVEVTQDRAHVHAGLTADLLTVLDVDALLADPALAVDDAG